MSLVQLSNVCSHLQNASLARLGLTSIPHSRLHLMLTVELQKQGFLSSVVLGGPHPPDQFLPPTEGREASAAVLAAGRNDGNPRVTQTNRATRRLWLGLKYWDGEPVLRKMKMLSKPTQKLWLTHEDLSKIVRGKRSGYVDGMTKIGECLFLSTDKGIVEARDCMERRIGGMALCRAWG